MDSMIFWNALEYEFGKLNSKYYNKSKFNFKPKFQQGMFPC